MMTATISHRGIAGSTRLREVDRDHIRVQCAQQSVERRIAGITESPQHDERRFNDGSRRNEADGIGFERRLQSVRTWFGEQNGDQRRGVDHHGSGRKPGVIIAE